MCKLIDVKNFAGIKYSDYNLHELRRIVEIGEERFIVFSGYDEVLLPALTMEFNSPCAPLQISCLCPEGIFNSVLLHPTSSQWGAPLTGPL